MARIKTTITNADRVSAEGKEGEAGSTENEQVKPRKKKTIKKTLAQQQLARGAIPPTAPARRVPNSSVFESNQYMAACVNVSILLRPYCVATKELPDYYKVVQECMLLPVEIAHYDYLFSQMPWEQKKIKELYRDYLRSEEEWDWKIPEFKLTDTTYGNTYVAQMRKKVVGVWDTYKGEQDAKLGFDKDGNVKESQVVHSSDMCTHWSRGANLKKGVWILNSDLDRQAANALADQLMSENGKSEASFKTFLARYTKEKRVEYGKRQLFQLSKKVKDKWFDAQDDYVHDKIRAICCHLGLYPVKAQIPKSLRKRLERLVKWYNEIPATETGEIEDFSFLKKLEMPLTNEERLQEIKKAQAAQRARKKKANSVTNPQQPNVPGSGGGTRIIAASSSVVPGNKEAPTTGSQANSSVTPNSDKDTSPTGDGKVGESENSGKTPNLNLVDEEAPTTGSKAGESSENSGMTPNSDLGDKEAPTTGSNKVGESSENSGGSMPNSNPVPETTTAAKDGSFDNCGGMLIGTINDVQPDEGSKSDVQDGADSNKQGSTEVGAGVIQGKTNESQVGAKLSTDGAGTPATKTSSCNGQSKSDAVTTVEATAKKPGDVASTASETTPPNVKESTAKKSVASTTAETPATKTSSPKKSKNAGEVTPKAMTKSVPKAVATGSSMQSNTLKPPTRKPRKLKRIPEWVTQAEVIDLTKDEEDANSKRQKLNNGMAALANSEHETKLPAARRGLQLTAPGKTPSVKSFKKLDDDWKAIAQKKFELIGRLTVALETKYGVKCEAPWRIKQNLRHEYAGRMGMKAGFILDEDIAKEGKHLDLCGQVFLSKSQAPSFVGTLAVLATMVDPRVVSHKDMPKNFGNAKHAIESEGFDTIEMVVLEDILLAVTDQCDPAYH